MTLSACVSYMLGDGLASDAEVGDFLAGRGLGLVPVEDGPGFSWPGRFLGRWPSGDWVVLFGVPPGVVFDPSGRGVQADAIEAAFVIAAHEPSARTVAAPTSTGRVELIALAASPAAPMTSLASAPVVAGRGIEGDRYFDGAGTFSDPASTGRDLTFVDAAALADAGVSGLESRRNVVVSGIDLDALIGRRFRVGEVECLGRRRCEPCAHLQRLTRPGVLRALVHRGGLRADVIAGGTIRVGDSVAAL